jgi:hypothetical protein
LVPECGNRGRARRCTVVAAVAYLFLSFSGQKSQRPEQRGVNF